MNKTTLFAKTRRPLPARLARIGALVCACVWSVAVAAAQPDLPGRRTTPPTGANSSPAATPTERPASPVPGPGEWGLFTLEYTESVAPTAPAPTKPTSGGGIVGVLEGKVVKPMTEAGGGAAPAPPTLAKATLTIPLRLFLLRDELGLNFALVIEADAGQLTIDPRISPETVAKLKEEETTIFDRLDRYMRVVSEPDAMETQSSG
ncbi:MAG: hypothetical protein ACT4PL_11125, partial [Phycisphaerales bacterium]